MKTLQSGSRGATVRRWQQFLIGQGLNPGIADGVFGAGTAEATRAFQAKHRLQADGVVGNSTLGKAMMLGFEVVEDTPEDPRRGPAWPERPQFGPLLTTAGRQSLFGKFQFDHRPIAGNRENIVIRPTWERDNIVTVRVPQLVGVKGAHREGNVRFHRLAADQLVALFSAWEQAGLRDRVLSWAGSYVPRLVRGRTSLSNHAFGTAFDINVPWNPLGARPALVGEQGCVRELVSIANDHGFYWGGHFRNRPDGMHFEVAVIR